MTRDERFEACFLKYKNLVMRFVIDATGDYQAAQEICQQVFVRYYEYIDRVSSDFEKAWLIRCTQNAVIDYLRKNKRRKELFLETPIGEVREVNGALQEKSIAICEEKMNHRELLGKILAEVRKVNEQWYEILMLLCVEQCTHEETAQRLGISVMVLRARLYRARSYVRKHYGAEYRES